MYMHLHIALSSHDSLPPSGGGQDTMVSSQVQYYVKSSDLKKKTSRRTCWNIAFRGRVVEGLYCTLILTLMLLMSRVVHVVMFVPLSLVCVSIVSVIVSPSA